MRTKNVNYLSEKEYKLVTILRKLGFRRTTASVLAFLTGVGETTSPGYRARVEPPAAGGQPDFQGTG
ncbi:hypothetical protein Metfor_0397 [Methanoregula formicica SMSP]|uniref:Uncharacterized protein n=1 Tax=Methanoregula formicica (strain DSM 22288 / NBRC 105244 / SMSP) TaxID=593750 RepID=L0HBQ4_METFS|nr:hypothetical protein Metfor_0397 [Methanoregula formicica SMSP]